MIFYTPSDGTTGNVALGFAATVLRAVANLDYHIGPGDAPVFRVSIDPDKYLERIATVFLQDGNFNGRSPDAERFAICLANNKQDLIALALFRAIVAGNDGDILYRGTRKGAPLEPVAGTPGKLGYEGMFRFGTLALLVDEKDLAKKIFLEIVCNTPTKCYPIRLQDIRVESLEKLVSLGLETLPSGVLVRDELAEARSHQH